MRWVLRRILETFFYAGACFIAIVILVCVSFFEWLFEEKESVVLPAKTLRPITPHLTNRHFKSFDKSPDSPQVLDLEVFFEGQVLYSVWRLKSLWERVKFLFHGKVTIAILSNSQPPVTLIMNDETFAIAEEYKQKDEVS